MCRLAIFNKEAIEYLGKESMESYLDFLEQEQGGDGNGILFVKDGKIIVDCKGLSLTNKAIVDALYYDGILPDWFLYHTRIASKGTVSDSNCHPYTNEDKSFSLMMNGTDSSLGAFGKSRDITDTQVMFELLEASDRDVTCLTELSPRFMGFKEGKVFVTNPSGFSGLEYVKTEEGILIIASSFPPNTDSKSLKKNFVWFEGDEVVEDIPVKSFNSYISSSAYIDDFDRYYDYYNKRWVDVDNNTIVLEKDGIKTLKKEDLSPYSTVIKEMVEREEFVGVINILEDKFGDVFTYNGNKSFFDIDEDNIYIYNAETCDISHEIEIASL